MTTEVYRVQRVDPLLQEQRTENNSETLDAHVKSLLIKAAKREGHPERQDSAASKREGEWGGVGHFFMIPSQAGLLSG